MNKFDQRIDLLSEDLPEGIDLLPHRARATSITDEIAKTIVRLVGYRILQRSGEMRLRIGPELQGLLVTEITHLLSGFVAGAMAAGQQYDTDRAAEVLSEQPR